MTDREKKAQLLAQLAAEIMWDHWKLYKHGWDDAGAAPEEMVTLFNAALPEDPPQTTPHYHKDPKFYDQLGMEPACAREAATPGYAPCTRPPHEDGPCAHPLAEDPDVTQFGNLPPLPDEAKKAAAEGELVVG